MSGTAHRDNSVGLRRSISIQSRVIWALFLRETLTRFGRHNIGFLWLFVEPMMFTLGVTAMWTALKTVHGSNLPIVAFAITGYSSVLLWRNMTSRCIGALTPNLSLLYHRNVRPIDVFASRLLLEGAGATMSFVFLVIVFGFIGWLQMPEDVLQVLAAWILLWWFGSSLAVFLGAFSETSETVEKLWHPFSYLLFPLSGAAFLVDALPKVAQDLVLWLPMVNGTEFLREGYFGSRMVAHYDLAYMISCNLGLTILVLAKLSQVSLEVVPE